MQTPSPAVSRHTTIDDFLVQRMIALAMWPDDDAAPVTDGPLRGCVTQRVFDHPMDAEDFGRCRLLFERMPSITANFRAAMPQVSTVWAALVSAWDTLSDTLDAECPDWRSKDIEAPNTTAMIRQIIRGAIVDRPGAT